MMRKKHKTWPNSFPEWKNKLLPPQPLRILCLWPHLRPKNSNLRFKNYFQTNHNALLVSLTRRMLQAGDADFQGPILIFLNGPSEFHAQSSDWQILRRWVSPTTHLQKHTIRTKQTQHPAEAYISMTPSLNSSKVSSLLDWLHTQRMNI